MNRHGGMEKHLGIGGGQWPAISKASQEALNKGEQLALKRRPNEAAPYLFKAMEDPNNVDAAIQLAFLCPTFKDSIEILEVSEKKAKAILKRILGQTVFEDDRVGRFWEIVATRPYMRVLQALVRFYFEDKQYSSAAKTIIEMLRLCPGDNMGQRDWLAPILCQAGRYSDALYFSQQWLQNQLGRGELLKLGGCDFKKPTSELMPDALEEKMSKFSVDYMIYTAALASFKLYGDSPLSRQYLRMCAKLNPVILSRILAKNERPTAPNNEPRGLNSPQSAHDYLFLAQNLWTEDDVYNWALNNEDAVKIILRECCMPGCSKSESKPNEFKRCADCKKTWYCSKECQKKHWPDHRKACKQYKQAQKMMKAFMNGKTFTPDPDVPTMPMYRADFGNGMVVTEELT